MLALYLAISKMEVFFFIWLIFGFIGFFGIPYAIYSRNRVQTIVIENGEIHFFGVGVLPGSKISFDHQYIKQLTLEHYDEESVFSLNVHSTKRPKRIMLANFVQADDKVHIFKDLKSFFTNHDIICEFINKKA